MGPGHINGVIYPPRWDIKPKRIFLCSLQSPPTPFPKTWPFCSYHSRLQLLGILIDRVNAKTGGLEGLSPAVTDAFICPADAVSISAEARELTALPSSWPNPHVCSPKRNHAYFIGLAQGVWAELHTSPQAQIAHTLVEEHTGKCLFCSVKNTAF